MEEPEIGHAILRFGEFTLDEARAALFCNGAQVHLRRQSFEVLKYLAGHAGRLVTKDELFAEVWPGTVVTDDSLTQCLVEIRRVLGDGGREIIRTVPRRGFVFEAPVDAIGGEGPGAKTAVRLPGRSGNLRRPALVALALAATAAGALWWAAGRLVDRAPVADATSDATGADVSIAVLPFLDLSDAQDQQFFAEGLSEEILNLLAQIPELRVIARTSSFSFRSQPEKDIDGIARTLGVTHVLEGSVRKAGNRARITAQLVAAADSSHLWSNNYDRELGDLLVVQSEIAGEIARALKLQLASATGGSGAPAAVDPRAYEHYLHARFLHSRRAPGDLAAAERHFLRAVDIDEGFGRAWAGLAGTLLVRLHEQDGSEGPDVVMERMRDAVEHALALEPGSAEVQIRAANYFFQAGELERAREHRRRARDIDPDHPLVLGAQVGTAHRRGDREAAVKLWERALLRDPLGFIARRNYALDLAIVGRYEDAYREFQRARELNPARPTNDIEEATLLYLLGRHAEALQRLQSYPDGAARDALLAIVLHALGRLDEARHETARLMQRPDPQRAVPLAEVYAQRGEIDAALAWIERARAVEAATAPLPGLRRFPDAGASSPLLRPVYADPRWQRFNYAFEY